MYTLHYSKMGSKLNLVIMIVAIGYVTGVCEARHRRETPVLDKAVDVAESSNSSGIEDDINDGGIEDDINEDAPLQKSADVRSQEDASPIVADTRSDIDDKHRLRHHHKHAEEKNEQVENKQQEETKNTDDTNTKKERAVERVNVDFPTSGHTDAPSDTQRQHEEKKPIGEKQGALVDKLSTCSTCTRREQEKKLMVEEVKMNILRRLGLTSAPKVDSPIHPLPFDFYMGEDFAMNDKGDEEDEEIDEHAVRTREMFFFGKDITDQCVQKKGTGCYSFNISEQLVNGRSIASAELWVYKQADLNDHYIQTFMVSELSKHVKEKTEYLRPKNIVKRVETRLKHGWIKIYVKRAILRWLSKPVRNNGFAVTCKTCKRRNHRAIYGDKEGLMPILVIYMKDVPAKRRVRRYADCIEGGTNCCHKEELEVTFSEMGWNYIMAPPSIRPNFCVGSCNGQQAANYNHTKLLQTLKLTAAYTHLQPCCSPVSFRRPQRLIYQDDQGVVRKIDVPDLLVGECGCS